MQLDTDQQTDSYQVDDTQSVAQQTDSLPEDDTPSAILDETDSFPEDETLSAVLDESVPSFRTFTMLSVRDVKQLIQNSALQKSCPLDPMPSTLVSKCEDLLPVLTKIVNNSLQSG